MMSATKPCDAGDPIGQPGHPHPHRRPALGDEVGHLRHEEPLHPLDERAGRSACSTAARTARRPRAATRRASCPTSATSPAGRSVCAVVACSTVCPSTVPWTCVWLVARAWTTTSTASSTTSPGLALRDVLGRDPHQRPAGGRLGGDRAGGDAAAAVEEAERRAQRLGDRHDRRAVALGEPDAEELDVEMGSSARVRRHRRSLLRARTRRALRSQQVGSLL